MSTVAKENSISPSLQSIIQKLTKEFEQIPGSRKPILQELTGFVDQKSKDNLPANLNFICTQNPTIGGAPAILAWGFIKIETSAT